MFSNCWPDFATPALQRWLERLNPTLLSNALVLWIAFMLYLFFSSVLSGRWQAEPYF